MSPIILAALALLASPIEHPDRLSRFYAALSPPPGDPAQVRVTHFGDSHIAADQFTGTLRTVFQERFGDGGRGFVLAGKPWRSYWQQGVKTQTSGAWHADGLRGGLDDGLFGPGGCSMRTVDPTASASVESHTPFTQLEVHYLRQPRGGCFEVRFDGRPVARISSRGPWIAPGIWRYTVEGDAPTQVSMHHVGDGETRLLGVSLTRPGGVVWDALGLNGAKATRLLEIEPLAFATWMSALAPKLIVLSYGANELFDDNLDPTRYADALDRVLTRVRAATPGADCLMTGPPDMLKHGQALPLADSVYSIQRALADAHGCAFWDARAAMGGPGAIRKWRRQGLARRDFVHFKPDGYAKLGQALATALFDGLRP